MHRNAPRRVCSTQCILALTATAAVVVLTHQSAAQAQNVAPRETFVQLVEQHGEGTLWAAVKGVVDDEDDADITLLTAHKAKGREWNSVRLADDFVSTRQGSDRGDSEAEVRLFYVAMMRARKVLSVDPALLTHFTTDAWKKPREA